MTDSQSASQSWCQAPIWYLRPDFCFCQTAAGVLMWDPFSDERTGQTLECTMYNTFTFYMLLHEWIYNIYKASLSPGSVQQIMPYH
jgi:hypothetical protein